MKSRRARSFGKGEIEVGVDLSNGLLSGLRELAVSLTPSSGSRWVLLPSPPSWLRCRSPMAAPSAPPPLRPSAADKQPSSMFHIPFCGNIDVHTSPHSDSGAQVERI